MASSCKYCGVTGGQAVTSKCFPREIENQQHHEFVVAILAPPSQSGKLSHRAVFRIGFSISESFSCRYPNSQFSVYLTTANIIKLSHRIFPVSECSFSPHKFKVRVFFYLLLILDFIEFRR